MDKKRRIFLLKPLRSTQTTAGLRDVARICGGRVVLEEMGDTRVNHRDYGEVPFLPVHAGTRTHPSSHRRSPTSGGDPVSVIQLVDDVHQDRNE